MSPGHSEARMAHAGQHQASRINKSDFAEACELQLGGIGIANIWAVKDFSRLNRR